MGCGTTVKKPKKRNERMIEKKAIDRLIEAGLWHNIFDYLSMADLAKASLVCK